MAGEAISPNMSLLLPGVGVTLGPLWATDLNTSLTIIDGHDHSSGSGVQITPDGLNITAALTMQNNNLTSIKSLQFQAQSAVITDLRSAYVVSKDLYFTDGDGNNVRITQSGGIAGTPGSISNLNSPASASYVAASSKFLWESDTSTPAIMDAGYLIIRNISTSGYGLTLQAPTLSSNYAITLPALPASQKIVTLDASGNLSAPYTTDNSTLEISSNLLQQKDLGTTTAKIAALAVTTAKIAALNVTRPKLEAVGQQVSSTCGSFSSSSGSAVDVTNLTVTLTTSGRPVVLFLIPDGSANVSEIDVQQSAGGVGVNQTALVRDGANLALYRLGAESTGGGTGTMRYPPGVISYLDVVSAGTYVYKIQTGTITGPGCNFKYIKLVAYEL